MPRYKFDKFDEDLGKVLTRFREGCNMTQQEAADKLTEMAQKTISRSTVKAWECGDRKMKAEDIALICKLYNASADQLLGNYGDKAVSLTGLSFNSMFTLAQMNPNLVYALNTILESDHIEKFLNTVCSAIELQQFPWRELSPEEKEEYTASWKRLRQLGLFPFDQSTACEMMIELAKKDLGEMLEEIIAMTGKTRKAASDINDTEDGRGEMEG